MIASCLVVGLAAPLGAQQAQAPAAAPLQAAQKFQVNSYESTLRTAVQGVGQQVADQARHIVSSIQLQYTSDLIVNGWYSDDFGYEFDVVVPDIMPTTASMFQLLQQQAAAAASAAAGAGGPVRAVSGSNGAGAATTAQSDPLIQSSVVPFMPLQEYSDRVRQALIDALVDNSGGLVFRPGERLRIVAGPGPEPVPNPLQPDSRRLILTIKGEDLAAFHHGDLSRDELMTRIKESHF